MKKNDKQVSRKKINQLSLATASLGAWMVVFGIFFAVIFGGIMIMSKSVDLVLLYPLVFIVMGLVLIKLSKVEIKTALPAIAENIIGLLFPFF